MAKEKQLIQQIKERKWKWTGHTLRKDSQVKERQVLNWNPRDVIREEDLRRYGGEW
jgi:hypothetical protein